MEELIVCESEVRDVDVTNVTLATQKQPPPTPSAPLEPAQGYKCHGCQRPHKSRADVTAVSTPATRMSRSATPAMKELSVRMLCVKEFCVKEFCVKELCVKELCVCDKVVYERVVRDAKRSPTEIWLRDLF